LEFLKECDNKNLIFCNYCKKNSPEMHLEVCSTCITTVYCDHLCQRNDWNEHKKVCNKIVL
jgi:hypothetical protein